MLEFKYSVRRLRASPGFVATACLTLALGIGAATAMFSVIDALLIRSLPFGDSDRLIYVRQFSRAECPRCYDMPSGNYLTLRDELREAVELVAQRAWAPVLRGTDRTDVVQGSRVTTDFFSTLGASMSLGRGFLPSDSVSGAEPVVILSDVAWRTRMGASSDVIGQVVVLDGVPHTVVGVLRPGLGLLPSIELWAPLRIETVEAEARSGRTRWRVDVFGRLQAGVSVGDLRVRLAVVAGRLGTEFPDLMRGWEIVAAPMAGWRGDMRPAILLSTGAVTLLVLVSAINLAGLLLTRLSSRQREFAIRSALGAPRRGVIGQILVENSLVSFLGAALGLIVAYWMIHGIRSGVPPEVARMQLGWTRLHLNPRAFVAALGVAGLTGVGVGFGPAIRFSRTDVVDALRGGLRGMDAARRGGLFRRALVVSEVALSVVLLAAGFLLVRSVANMTRADSGIRAENVLTMMLQRGRDAGDSTDLVEPDLFDRLSARIASLPGVRGAGVVAALPMNRHYNSVPYEVEGRPVEAEQRRPAARLQTATPGYFAAMGIPILSGRSFTEDDRGPRPPVCIVNATLRRASFGSVRAVGSTLLLGRQRCEIVGVVGDVYHNGVNDEAGAEVYVPRAYSRSPLAELAVRTTDAPTAFAPAITRAVREFDSNIAVNAVRPMADIEAQFVAPYRVLLGVMLGFAAAGFLISAIGLYGVVSYTVTTRRREFGIRLALGAQSRGLSRMVLVETLRMTALGGAVGMAASMLTTRVLGVLLYGVGTGDPLAMAGVVVALLTLAAVAAYAPAHRVSRLDPTRAVAAE